MSLPSSQADQFLDHYLARHGLAGESQYALSASLAWRLNLATAVVSLLCLGGGQLELALLGWSAMLFPAAAGLMAWRPVILCAALSLAGYLLWHGIDPAPLQIKGDHLAINALIGLASYLFGQRLQLKRALAQRSGHIHVLRQFSDVLTGSKEICLKEISLEGRLVAINRFGQALMEICSFEQVRDADWLAFWKGEWASPAHEAFAQALRGHPGRFMGYCPTASGVPKWWDVLLVPIVNRQGQVESILGFSWDVTEAQESTAALKRAHQEFDALLGNLNDGFYRLDQDWRFIQVNEKAEELLALRRDKLLGQDIRTLFPEDMAEEYGTAFGDVMHSGIPRHFEFYSACFFRWYRISAYPRPNGITVFFSDITSDVASVQKRQTDEARLRLTQGIGRFADWQFMLSNRELLVSSQAMQLLGLSEEKGRLHQDVFLRQLHPDDRLAFVAALLDLTEGKATLNVVARVQDTEQAGQWRDFQFAGVLLRPQAHPAGLLVGCMQDISDQKDRERRLIEAEVFTRSILDALPQRLCVLDEKGHVLTMNKAWSTFIRVHGSIVAWPEEGESYFNFCRAAAKGGVIQAWTLHDNLQALLNGTGDPFNLEYHVELNGELRWFNVFALLMDTEPKQLLVVHEDITERAQLQAAVEVQAQRLRLAHEGSNDGLWEWRPENEALYVSERFTALTGDTLETYHDFTVWLDDHVHPDERQILSSALQDHLQHKAPFDIELRLDTAHGWHWFRLRGKAEWDEDTLTRFAGSLMDISLQRDLLEQFQASEARFREMVEFLPHVFWVYDTAQATLSYVSPALEKTWGIDADSLYEDMSVWMELVHEDDRAIVQRFQYEVTQLHQQAEAEYRSFNRHGDPLWIRNRTFPLRNAAGQVYRIIGIAENVTEAHRYKDQLYAAAHYDHLCGLPNRLMLQKRLEEQCVHAEAGERDFHVLLITLDRHKWIQQCLGQSAYDEVIGKVAERFQNALNGQGYLASLGGDEFAVLLSRESESNHCQHVVDALLKSLDSQFKTSEAAVKLTAAIGIARFPADGDTAEQLIRSASAAVYAVQKSGRSGYQFFDKGLLENNLDALKLEADLTRAIEQKEFVLYYQPKLCLGSQSICSAEALIRWQHPVYGLVSPLRFIPLLEETGLIVPVGLWCIDQALAQVAQWQKQGLGHFVIAVNLSIRQLQPGLVEEIRKRLAYHKVAPACLELELTESIMHDAEGESGIIINALKALGVRIAVDDFGTGYATLGSLRSFVPDTLKIDRSFLNEMITNEADQAIVRSVIDMAHALHMTVVAEGVETVEQQRLLEGLKCDQIQGYLISTPVSAAVFASKHINLKQQA
ncbi:PAS domain S-box-containing protein/diguanylate cyclase (GGDEF)-like protein [Pseudomonas duriflava]|uniref:PAS domain S-box-containing protein/diguanylate cyclase (GGDEF)-like protein n=1 Tax=Pseudomonas duriflava TaxID=459528 RepID=A0A562Q979_9PSED|nr:EAL domain-containing protein [Pseudomonas duriflava]TWI52730.1 PAS domain S-box-containing protein/diguanylate cyclase (GGDEF)-like protein [Pseudomonas duriflava]